MGVYIKGMEMPKSCWECPMVSGYEIADEAKTICSTVRCRLTNTKRQAGEAIAPNCPLVPVPPHGDLVDLKAPFKAQYYDEMTEEWLEKIVTVEDVLYGCMVDEMPPTIIAAEPFNNLTKPCKDDDDIPICTKASPASLGIYKKAEEG